MYCTKSNIELYVTKNCLVWFYQNDQKVECPVQLKKSKIFDKRLKHFSRNFSNRRIQNTWSKCCALKNNHQFNIWFCPMYCTKSNIDIIGLPLVFLCAWLRIAVPNFQKSWVVVEWHSLFFSIPIKGKFMADRPQWSTLPLKNTVLEFQALKKQK